MDEVVGCSVVVGLLVVVVDTRSADANATALMIGIMKTYLMAREESAKDRR